MINIIDIIIGVGVLFYLLKNTGGVMKTAKNFLVVIVILILFGIVAQLLLVSSFAAPTHKLLGESYSVKVSQLLIHWIYPPLRGAAPKVDTFMNEKILFLPTPEVKEILPEKVIPKLAIPEPTKPK